ncbi:hypothetical protein B9J09_05880 [Xylella fastidiosa subsp. pauca]|uniref:Lcl domain-containing protein n=1 Tax=Xylella fastidiosa TaxID=2371 RepID=UPI0005837707|nr:DUF1566 domain-containing protein [Xylella fastidiosa]ARO68616.1 hypothetical protein B9J09_05880 [Xylella fastidiosa subsp. pauca]AVI20707.1 hypothetical protein BCV75_05425 [Xylella fastidiosa]AVI22735.1 hypothetical protein BC375_05485 [Xylella fastidiosa]KIA57996.1 hypothetical protein RA12_05405 [Xylella fastidiosa]KXB12066.1 hypothetical protein ADT32_04760 [Xylella fastidiosa]
MSTATLENVPTPGGTRFTKIYDTDGYHAITRDEHKGLEWLTGYVGGPSSNAYGPDCDAAEECRQLAIWGYDNWRLPTQEEALSANGAAAYLRWEEPSYWIWTCTPDDDHPREAAWVVKFGTNHTAAVYRTAKYLVCAVRGQMRTDATATPKAGES